MTTKTNWCHDEHRMTKTTTTCFGCNMYQLLSSKTKNKLVDMVKFDSGAVFKNVQFKTTQLFYSKCMPIENYE